MKKITEMIKQENALPGRDNIIKVSSKHILLNTSMKPPFDNGLAIVVFGMGCFWGAEKLFWTVNGVHSTAVGYAGGYTPNANYEEVCSGMTGHTEVVQVVYNPETISLDDLLVIFWQEHDPTQGMRQGNDIGTQYRSAIYLYNKSAIKVAKSSKLHYGRDLNRNGFPAITTEIRLNQFFYYAEDYHQQYLAKNPDGYCGLSGSGVRFSINGSVQQ